MQLQLPALGDTDAEVDAQQRLKNVLETKKIVQTKHSSAERSAALDSQHNLITGSAKVVKQKTVDTLLRRKSAH